MEFTHSLILKAPSLLPRHPLRKTLLPTWLRYAPVPAPTPSLYPGSSMTDKTSDSLQSSSRVIYLKTDGPGSHRFCKYEAMPMFDVYVLHYLHILPLSFNEKKLFFPVLLPHYSARYIATLPGWLQRSVNTVYHTIGHN